MHVTPCALLTKHVPSNRPNRPSRFGQESINMLDTSSISPLPLEIIFVPDILLWSPFVPGESNLPNRRVSHSPSSQLPQVAMRWRHDDMMAKALLNFQGYFGETSLHPNRALGANRLNSWLKQL